MRRFLRATVAVLVLVLSSTTFADATSTKDPRTDAPETPSRGDVVAAMNSVTEAVLRCGGGWQGAVPVRVIFEGSTGRATSVTVRMGETEPSVPPAVAACVERAAIAARVPPFRQATYSVNYPFRIR